MAGNSAVSLPYIIALGTDSAASLEAITAVGHGDSAPLIALQAITAISAGFTGIITSASQPTLVVPAIIAASTGAEGALGVSSVSLPQITTIGYEAGRSVPLLLGIIADSAGYTGQVGQSVASRAYLQATGTGLIAPFGVSDETLLRILASGTGIFGSVGVSAVTAGQIVPAARGYAGIVGQSSEAVLPYTANSAGYAPAIGVSTLAIPAIFATGRGTNGATALFSTIVMHTESMALTTYSSFPFNSLAAFAGVYLGASDNGLFTLSGPTDDGDPIAAVARTGISDFDSSFLKRVPRVYVGGRFDGDMILRVITDEADTRDYPIRSTGITGIHGNHVKIGKKVKSRYWQFEVQNTNGCDFDLNAIEARPVPLRRRIGGRDA